MNILAKEARARLKEKYPDAIVLMREGDFYRVYEEDAEKTKQTASVPFCIDNGMKVGCFPHYDIDKVLPKLVRAGHRCAICDDATEPKRKIKRSTAIA